MKRLYVLPLVIVTLLCFTSCEKDENYQLDDELSLTLDAAAPGGKASFQLPRSNDYAAIPQDPLNPLTGEKVNLGRLLYHETGLAIAPMLPEGEGKFSCASCHFAAAGFQAGRFQGIGEGGSGIGEGGVARLRLDTYKPEELDVQPIRTPTVLNTAYQELMLWNGQFGAGGANVGTEANWTEGTPIATNHLGYQGLEIQAIAGMKVHRLDVDLELAEDLGYKTLFDAAFPDWPAEERYTRETAGLAIAAYERTILANRSPFQLYLQGRTAAMTDAQKRGAIVFFGPANCVSCHSGPALSSMTFHALGMNDLDQCPEEIFGAGPESGANLGRGGFTKRDEEKYAFKTPTLYNLADSPFYGHGASFRSIREVIDYKNKGVPQNERVAPQYISPQFGPLRLSDEEVGDLVEFLTSGLRDNDLSRYQPQEVLSGQCFPNNDHQSSIDLGCN
ncbi:MAG: cytochrome c peroxidase [Bacteroidota bacterium]